MIKQEKTLFLENIIGDSTSEVYRGAFVFSTKLSFSDMLKMDRLRRTYLGGENQENASQFAVNIANAIADLSVRVIEGPPWWKESNFGLNLKDYNVLNAVYDLAMLAQKEDEEEREKKKREASDKLRELSTPTPPPPPVTPIPNG
jgi:hypothetical protein